jgi:hypothetical protein
MSWVDPVTSSVVGMPLYLAGGIRSRQMDGRLQVPLLTVVQSVIRSRLGRCPNFH